MTALYQAQVQALPPVDYFKGGLLTLYAFQTTVLADHCGGPISFTSGHRY